MDYTLISSKDNKLIKYVAKLQKSSHFRRDENRFVLEGLRICKDAAENGVLFEYVFLSESFLNKFSDDISLIINACENIYLVKDFLFSKMGDTETPQGIIAVGIIPSNKGGFNSFGRYVALDGLGDPSNLGAVSRTCEALGVSGIIVSNNSCDPYSPKVLRASMGTVLRMPIYITDDIPSFLKEHKLRSFSCVVESSAMPVSSVDFCNGDVIIIGNEANGISDYVKANSDFLITVKMKGKAESLNAAAAAAIVAYELTK